MSQCGGKYEISCLYRYKIITQEKGCNNRKLWVNITKLYIANYHHEKSESTEL